MCNEKYGQRKDAVKCTMLKQFQEDLRRAKVGERITLKVLQNCTSDYRFTDVSSDKRYYHLGDIDAYDIENDKHYYIDVKMDGRIAQTRNILCEESVYFCENNQTKPGCMSYDYDYLAILSVSEKMIYIVDFTILKQHYTEGKPYTRHFEEQSTYGYLFPLRMAHKYHAVVAAIKYDDTNKIYTPKRVWNFDAPQSGTEAS